jgi:hypothetical protein
MKTAAAGLIIVIIFSLIDEHALYSFLYMIDRRKPSSGSRKRFDKPKYDKVVHNAPKYEKRRTTAIASIKNIPVDSIDYSQIVSGVGVNPVASGKNYGGKSILGEAIIDCRPFSIDSPKIFEFEGSYDNAKTAPVFGLPGDHRSLFFCKVSRLSTVIA